MTNTTAPAPLITAAMILELEANVARLADEVKAAGVRVSRELATAHREALDHMLNTRNAHGVARYYADAARIAEAKARRFAA